MSRPFTEKQREEARKYANKHPISILLWIGIAIVFVVGHFVLHYRISLSLPLTLIVAVPGIFIWQYLVDKYLKQHFPNEVKHE